ncbi:hypothetical protein GV054_09185 [Marinomonas mediterranea]|jgi:hypothetical protein|uniref:Uncharacterized protein n=1 Tax=Marinomonas mediterranea (strain ATCC 700492 / JCM 21426 / NBRC 103028 / MMB-1) TaxID=717774 RepID=F2K229_MARM1|nr:hypothetical protein [Marinomonas mediterranea]ADZ91107.1 hypothetical protein Marme_1851 [Marinomonas mediterranea MMB-1]WCN13168.1 hypothetical protein GV054_09185 [Marinomonas mediterranea]WCN17239.1 hypothetical protein GV053_09345 [Marinomonas mediterranea MMB-1]
MRVLNDGAVVYYGSLDGAESLVFPAGCTYEYTDSEVRLKKRLGILEAAGDHQSLLGANADAAELLLVEFSKLVVSLESADSFDDFKKASNSFVSDANIVLDGMDSGKYKFPYQSKGQSDVIEDISERATEVSKILSK